MQIFKFGGASVKDAQGVKNLAHVLKTVGYSNTLIVVSAMGKTTNAMETVIANYFEAKHKLQSSLQEVKKFHNNILLDLFDNKSHPVFETTNKLFQEIVLFFEHNKSPNYNFVYDQVIGFGELISTTIISHYLNEIGITNTWLDVRTFIKTDDYYRNSKVNWNQTQGLISTRVDTSKLNITQGFLGSDSNNFTTTLGREGSDYTAAIFAYCLNANSVTIWKDVQGVLNADPRLFQETQLLEQISYEETIEMAFYGASVIHPKTIQPLQSKEIPLFVRSFINPDLKGTKISRGVAIKPHIPCFIVKKNQVFISISTLDFSFMIEDNISHIFKLLHQYQLRVNLIQNSAISFSVCVDNKFNHFDAFYDSIKSSFKVSFVKEVDLYTVRHFTNETLNTIDNLGKSLITQINKETAQIVVKQN